MVSRFLWMAQDSACYALAALPFLAAWSFWFSRKRLEGAGRLAAGFWLFALYLCGVAAVTGLPSVQYLTFYAHIQLMPFHELRADAVQYFLNIVLFLPAGFLLPLLWGKYGRLKETVLFGFLLSVLIECSQLFCFRTTDLNDLLMNTLGAVFGWAAWRILCRGRTLRMRAASPWQAAAMVWAAAFLFASPISGFVWERLYP